MLLSRGSGGPTDGTVSGGPAHAECAWPVPLPTPAAFLQAKPAFLGSRSSAAWPVGKYTAAAFPKND